jgi:hypothetical protein
MEFGAVIQESDPIVISFRTGDRERSMEVRMDEFKWCQGLST